jgi:hypothetical protein
MIGGIYDECYFFGPRARLDLKAPTLEKSDSLLE